MRPLKEVTVLYSHFRDGFVKVGNQGGQRSVTEDAELPSSGRSPGEESRVLELDMLAGLPTGGQCSFR